MNVFSDLYFFCIFFLFGNSFASNNCEKIKGFIEIFHREQTHVWPVGFSGAMYNISYPTDVFNKIWWSFDFKNSLFIDRADTYTISEHRGLKVKTSSIASGQQISTFYLIRNLWLGDSGKKITCGIYESGRYQICLSKRIIVTYPQQKPFLFIIQVFLYQLSVMSVFLVSIYVYKMEWLCCKNVNDKNKNKAAFKIIASLKKSQNERKIVQATNAEATNAEATNVEATNAEATNAEATNVEATNIEATNIEATNGTDNENKI